MKETIYQYSCINALMGGVFNGLFPISDIKQKGNFGIGCSADLSGELIIHGCHFLEAKGHRVLRKMNDTELLPFAQITTFSPEVTFIANEVNKENLYNHLAQKTLLDNVFLAVKIEGIFDSMQIRRPDDSGKVYKTALDVAENQVVDHLSTIEGSLIGFWTPKFFENISVAGFHLHFIDKEQKIGGHMIDFALSNAKISYQVKSGINIELSKKESYLQQDLNIEDMSSIIKKVEN